MQEILAAAFSLLIVTGAFAADTAKDTEIAHIGLTPLLIFLVVVVIFCGWVILAMRRATRKDAEEAKSAPKNP